MATKILVGGTAIVTIVAGLAMTWNRVRQEANRGASVTALGFKFEILENQGLDSGFGPMRYLGILLSPDDYSRANLEKLFRHISDQYRDLEEKLTVKVYTSLENRKLDLADSAQWFILSNRPRPLDPTQRTVFYDAVFYRQGDGLVAGGGENEWFTFSPDLDEPRVTQTVVLRGWLKFAPKRELQQDEKASRLMRVRATIYEYHDVQPKGPYSVFEYATAFSADWKTILNWPLEGRVSLILSEHSGFVDDRTAYVFLGPVFAVTTDGATWSRWDARSYVPGDNHEIITVRIEPHGRGQMALRYYDHGVKTLELGTRNHGRTWDRERD